MPMVISHADIYTFYKISVDFMSVSAYTNCVGINDFFWAGRKTQVLHWRGSSPPFFTNSQPSITKLNQELSYLSLDNLCIHTGPIIRREEIYKNMTIKERRHIFNKMVAFIRQINIRYKCFYIEKKNTSDVVEATGKLSKQISQFIHDHYEDFLSFDDVKIYYDNGQVEVSKILSSVFNSLLPISKSEIAFFGNIRDLKKNYIKPLRKKEWS